MFAGAVEEIVPEPPTGEHVRILLVTRPPLVAEVTKASAEALGLGPGQPVFASFKATGVAVVR